MLSTDSEVRITLYRIINSVTGKNCSIHFIWMITPKDFIHRLKRRTTFFSIINSTTAQYISFEWSHSRISSTDSKLRTTLYSHSIINITTVLKVLLNMKLLFEWSHLRISSRTQKSEPACTAPTFRAWNLWSQMCNLQLVWGHLLLKKNNLGANLLLQLMAHFHNKFVF